MSITYMYFKFVIKIYESTTYSNGLMKLLHSLALEGLLLDVMISSTPDIQDSELLEI